MDPDNSYEQMYREVMRRPLPSEDFVVPREAPTPREKDPYERLLVELRRALVSGERGHHES